MRVLVFDAECVLTDTRYPLKDALEDLGHRADVFDWSYYFPRHTDSRLSSRIKSRIFESHYVSLLNKHLRSAVSKIRYDLVLIVMGRYIYPETIQFIKQHSGCVVNWNSDDIFNMSSSSEFAKSSLPLFDIHFTPRPHLMTEYKEHGARNVVPLGWYFRPGLIYSRDTLLPLHYKYPVSFVGSWSSYRQSYLSEIMKFGTNVFGWGWQHRSSNKFSEHTNYIHPAVAITTMHNIFHNSGININILTLENRDVSNLRNFEIPAAMGFQLAERSEYVLGLFDEGAEIVCFSDVEELISKCKYYIENEQERRKIARAGYDRLLRSNYSLAARLNEVISHVKAHLL